MTEEQLNKEWLRKELKGFSYSNELLDKILELLSNQYINGLEQSRFDKRMLEYENQELKKQLQELEKENLNLREYIMTNKMAIPHEEIKDKSLYDLYTIPSYSDLSKENQELKKQLKIKHNGFMASVDESCDLAKENQKYKEVIDEAIEILGKYTHFTTPSEEQNSYNEDLVDKVYNMLKEVE